jgi:hypothetical protein
MMHSGLSQIKLQSILCVQELMVLHISKGWIWSYHSSDDQENALHYWDPLYGT